MYGRLDVYSALLQSQIVDVTCDDPLNRKQARDFGSQVLAAALHSWEHTL